MFVERRPLARRLAMALGERIPVRSEAVTDEPCVGIDSVGDEQGAHRRYGTQSDDGPAGRTGTSRTGALSAAS